MKTEIINAAIKLFEENGIKFTLSQVAEEMGISKKTIYKYFTSKEELIHQAIDYVFDDIDRQHKQILNLRIPLVDKLKMILKVYPSTINIYADKMSKMEKFAPELYEYVYYHYTINWEITLNILDSCISAGLIKDIPHECFQITMIGIYDNLLNYENHKEMLDICIDFIFNGLENKKLEG